MLKSEIKKHAAYYGIFLGILFFTFAVLVTATLLSRNSWKTGLATEVQTVLNSYNGETYTVNKFMDLKSTLNTSCAVYSLIKKGAPSGEEYYGVIIRIPTIIGPVPAVFVYNAKSNVTFAGFAMDTGKAADLINIKLASSNIKYWESMIPKIVEKAQIK